MFPPASIADINRGRLAGVISKVYARDKQSRPRGKKLSSSRLHATIKREIRGTQRCGYWRIEPRMKEKTYIFVV
jgi:hypothetical protein